MCGLVGVYWYGGGVADHTLIARQNDALRHRGPDDRDVWSEGPVALGHRRLAIHDLSEAGRQPMSNETRTVWTVFNGAIYDWMATRADLLSAGHVFHSQTDSEILPHLWEERGERMVEGLRGMFAFAIYDQRRRTLMLARDRLGKKPLYYHDDGRRLVFASELKSLLLDPSVPRDVDPAAIADMLTFQYVPSPRTIWRGVRKLPGGHRLICDANGTRVERYWSLPTETDHGITPNAAVEDLERLLAESVRIRMAADVPVGAFLSGGIDSSAVVALMARETNRPISTYSVGFQDEERGELRHARVVARHLGTQHHELIVGPDSLELLPKLVWAMDEPFSDASMIPTYLVARLARMGVTVALTGDGGDEILGGYSTYLKAVRHARADGIPLSVRRAAVAAGRLFGSHATTGSWLDQLAMQVVDRHIDLMSRFGRAELAAMLAPELQRELRSHDPHATPRTLHEHASRALGPIPALLALDAQTYLTDDVLAKVDRLSMASSLEVRAPLLDQKVVEYAARLPFDYKLRGGITKWVLREAVKPLLPAEILRRGKQGFGLPLDQWYESGLARLGNDILRDPRCRNRGWLDPGFVDSLLAGIDVDAGRRAHQVFALCCLELWAQTWVDRPREALVRELDDLEITREVDRRVPAA